jgi:hypothetical protein
VHKVFGYAGDGINGLLAAWGRAENDPMFIQARHEEMAAFEAVGDAKYSGRVGVCTASVAATRGVRSATASRSSPPPCHCQVATHSRECMRVRND